MKTKITPNMIAVTKQAALRQGIELTDIQAENHASKIIENLDDEEFPQDFWIAAKEYFLN